MMKAERSTGSGRILACGYKLKRADAKLSYLVIAYYTYEPCHDVRCTSREQMKLSLTKMNNIEPIKRVLHIGASSGIGQLVLQALLAQWIRCHCVYTHEKQSGVPIAHHSATYGRHLVASSTQGDHWSGRCGTDSRGFKTSINSIGSLMQLLQLLHLGWKDMYW